MLVIASVCGLVLVAALFDSREPVRTSGGGSSNTDKACSNNDFAVTQSLPAKKLVL
jgi:hypothetical protein